MLQMRLKLYQKTADVTGNLIGYKIADRITKVGKSSPKNISKTNMAFIPLELRHRIINDLRLKKEKYWLSKI